VDPKHTSSNPGLQIEVIDLTVEAPAEPVVSAPQIGQERTTKATLATKTSDVSERQVNTQGSHKSKATRAVRKSGRKTAGNTDSNAAPNGFTETSPPNRHRKRKNPGPSFSGDVSGAITSCNIK